MPENQHDEDEDDQFESDEVTNYPNMRGARQSTGTRLLDPEDGMEKIFFVFADLSIRTMGRYRIVCRLFNMKT